MKEFQRKSVSVEAVQLSWKNWGEVCDLLGSIISENNPGRSVETASEACGEEAPFIELTLPSGNVVTHGDWIIRDSNGSLTHCMPGDFESLYEVGSKAQACSVHNSERVMQFHRLSGSPCDEKITSDLLSIRTDLMRESWDEVEKAVDQLFNISSMKVFFHGDLAEYEMRLMRALTDMKYSIEGFFVAFGWPSERLERAVHKSNMTKVLSGVLTSQEDGRVPASSSYVPPDLTSVVNPIREGLEESLSINLHTEMIAGAMSFEEEGPSDSDPQCECESFGQENCSVHLDGFLPKEETQEPVEEEEESPPAKKWWKMEGK